MENLQYLACKFTTIFPQLACPSTFFKDIKDVQKNVQGHVKETLPLGREAEGIGGGIGREADKAKNSGSIED